MYINKKLLRCTNTKKGACGDALIQYLHDIPVGKKYFIEWNTVSGRCLIFFEKLRKVR